MISNLEEAHRRETQEIRGQLTGVAHKVKVVENRTTKAEVRITALEELQAQHTLQLLALHLHVEDLEDRNRRNNLRQCGIPKAEGSEDLPQIVT